MILLNGHSLTMLRKIDVETQALVLKERQSTSSFTTADMTDITINSWMQDETNPGSGIVWRVKSIEQAFTISTPKVQLEHAINTLRDRILFGEITPETIAGSGATTCTAKATIKYILNQQSDWVLDETTFGYNSVSNPYKFDGDTLYDALEMVTKTLQDAWWSYDFSTYPFKLKITQKQSGVACELREGRNINTISKTIDRTGMYTRFYPIGKDDLHISGDYVSRNESTYGIISKVEVDSSLETTAELTAWANERLDKHAQPVVTVTVDGMDFADATGESLDRMTLGRLCRIPLPEFSTTIEERIIELNYRDKKNQPEVVRITLGNQRDDIAHIIANEIKQGGGQSGAGRGGGGGRGGVRQAKEDHAWFEDTDEHVAMCAEGIIGVDAQGNPNWTRLSQLIVDGAGIHGNVTSLLDGALYQQSNIEMNESKISLVVGRYNNQNYIKAAEITASINDAGEGVATINADHVNISGTNTVQTLAGAMEKDASGHLVIKDGAGFRLRKQVSGSTAEFGVYDENNLTSGVIATIVNGVSSTYISGDKIYIGSQSATTVINGKCSLSDVSATYIKTQLASAGQITVNGLNVIGDCYVRNSGGNQQNVSAAIWDLNIATNGNSYTLQRKRIQDSSWVDVGSFSRAVSSWLVGGGSGKVNVTALPQNQTKSVNISIDGTTSITSNGTYTYTADYENASGDDVSTGATKTVTVNVSGSHDIGFWEDSITSSSWNTWARCNGDSSSDAYRNYSLSVSGNTVSVMHGSTEVASIAAGGGSYTQVTDGTGAYRFKAYYKSSSGSYYPLGDGGTHQWFYA